MGGEEEDGTKGGQDVPQPPEEARKGPKHIFQDYSNMLEQN